MKRRKRVVVDDTDKAYEILTTKRVPIDSVKLWRKNPRINDKAAKKLAAILEQHGQITPIVVWEKDGVIYKGNTTWKAAKLLGWKTIEARYVWFPNQKAATAYAIADNRASEESVWDEDVLLSLMSDIEYPPNIDVGRERLAKYTGFDAEEIQALFMEPDERVVQGIKDRMKDKYDMYSFITVQCKTQDAEVVRWKINDIIEEEG